jgi:exopolyphosphatase/pppGpp-phosphohydrolase
MKARKLEGFSLSLSNLESLILRLLPLSLPQLRSLPGMPTDRASLALPAFLVLRETMLRLRLSCVQLTTHGLRYGVWLDSLAPCPIRKIIR